MYDKTLIKDNFGQHYTIQTYVNPQIRGSLSPKEFPDQHLAQQFVQRLQVPIGYWQGLMHDVGSIGSPMMSEADMVCAVCDSIVTGQLKIFAVNPPNHSSGAPKKRAIQTSDKVYHFVPSVEQLLNKTETKHFNRVEDAKTFLQELNPDTEQLKGMASELNIAVPATASANLAELSHAIAESMAAGDTVVMMDTITSATPLAKLEAVLDSSGAGNQKADLGPHETEEAPKHWFAVQLVNEADEPYTNETFTVNLSDKSTTKVDGGNPNYRKEQLPSGKCSIIFDGFYKQIEQWIGERSQ